MMPDDPLPFAIPGSPSVAEMEALVAYETAVMEATPAGRCGRWEAAARHAAKLAQMQGE
jgi:hypothetical protein